MADMKITENDRDVQDYIENIPQEIQRNDALALRDLMETITHEPPRMWGTSIVGFGRYHYKYATGREGDWFLTGFSARKQNLTIYIISGFDAHIDIMQKLGKFKTGKSCLYVKKLDDVDLNVLSKLIKESVARTASIYSTETDII